MKSKGSAKAQSARPSKANASTNKPHSPQNKRKRDGLGEEDELSVERPRKKYQTVDERVRRVPISIIESKWRVLPQSAIEQVHEVLRMSKRALMNQQDGKRTTAEAQTILDKVVKRLDDRQRKMKFPTKDLNFDLEKLNEQNVCIQTYLMCMAYPNKPKMILANQLTTNQHSVTLLRSEISKMGKLIERDQKFMSQLKKDAKNARQQQRQQEVKMHPLLRKGVNLEAVVDDPDSINLVHPADHERMPLNDVDSDLEPIVQQFRQHLANMENNSSQVQGIRESIANTRMALADVASERRFGQITKILAG